MYYRTKDSPHYPLFNDNLSALSGSAQGDATGAYSGENVSRLGLSGKVRGVKLFGNHWLGSAYLGFNNASSYNEWRTGVSLQYFFDSITNAGEFRHFLLREPEDRFQRFSR
jgi:Cellulose synthase operon protein C C-terminus (BCSC_C)